MDKLERAAVNGEEARQLLGHPMLAQAFVDTRAGILEAWAALPDSGRPGLLDRLQGKSTTADDLHRLLKMLDRVKRCLEIHVETGRLAQKEIEGKARILRRA
ncbi:MAG: hypothetical protein V4792_09765 [Pseudomonadota bacterium]